MGNTKNTSRKRKKKFLGNKHTQTSKATASQTTTTSPNISTSRKKISLEESTDQQSDNYNLIINFEILKELIQQVRM